MLMRILLASAHLLALGIGLGAIVVRARALLSAAASRSPEPLPRAFLADNFWAGAAGLWIVTGLTRAFAGFEKGSAYYLHSHFFWLKMSLLVLILALEVAPMIGLIRWRIRLKKGQPLELGSAHRYGVISQVQAALVVLMVFAASALARGWG